MQLWDRAVFFTCAPFRNFGLVAAGYKEASLTAESSIKARFLFFLSVT